VTLIFRWPSHVATSVIGTPRARRAETNACRKLCGVNPSGIPALLAFRLKE